jgi:hypothetical protein
LFSETLLGFSVPGMQQDILIADSTQASVLDPLNDSLSLINQYQKHTRHTLWMPDGREIVCQLPVATDHPRVSRSAILQPKKLTQKQVEKKGSKMLLKFEEFWNGLCYRKTGEKAIIGYELCMGMWLAEIDLLSEPGTGGGGYHTEEDVATTVGLNGKKVMGFFDQYFRKPELNIERDLKDGRVIGIGLGERDLRIPEDVG